MDANAIILTAYLTFTAAVLTLALAPVDRAPFRFTNRAVTDIWYAIRRMLGAETIRWLPSSLTPRGSACMDAGPLSPRGTIDLSTGASIRSINAEMTGALLKVALGGCPHPNAVPVETWYGERVAVLCPDCDGQLPAEWETGDAART